VHATSIGTPARARHPRSEVEARGLGYGPERESNQGRSAFGFRPESFIEAGDANAVIVIGRFEGDGVEGERLDEPGVQVWEFQGNAVARVRVFTDSAGFPPVITERREQELEEKEREGKEEEDERQEDRAEKQPDDKE
jgi:ketosteroid isomerase-like protein